LLNFLISSILCVLQSSKFATSNFSNRDLKLGSAGDQKLGSEKKGSKRGAAVEDISTGSPSTKSLSAAKSTDSTVINFGSLLQPVVKKLQVCGFSIPPLENIAV
jgi:hypothetical protein